MSNNLDLFGEIFINEVRDRTISLFDDMLCMFEDHEELKLLLNEENLVEESDGLAGELYTEDGWIKRYSKQRTREI